MLIVPATHVWSRLVARAWPDNRHRVNPRIEGTASHATAGSAASTRPRPGRSAKR